MRVIMDIVPNSILWCILQGGKFDRGAKMSFTLRIRDGNLDSKERTTFDDLKKALSDKGQKLHLHLHGGLIKEEDGLSTATAWAAPPNGHRP